METQLLDKLETVPCPICGRPFPKLRRDKFGYNFCIECSEVETVRGVSRLHGDGNDTWSDIDIVSKEEAEKIEKYYSSLEIRR